MHERRAIEKHDLLAEVGHDCGGMAPPRLWCAHAMVWYDPTYGVCHASLVVCATLAFGQPGRTVGVRLSLDVLSLGVPSSVHGVLFSFRCALLSPHGTGSWPAHGGLIRDFSLQGLML